MTLDIVVASFFRNALTLSLAAGSLLLGLLLQKLICRRLPRISLAGGAGWSDVLVRSLRGVVMIWVALAGTAAAIRVAAIPASIFLPLERAVIVAAILSVTVFVARAASGLTELYLTKAAGIPSTIFRNLAVIVVGIVGFLVVLDEVGIPIAPIITALGIGGLAFALALQDSLANLFAGLNILMSKNIRRGDYIRLASGEEGTGGVSDFEPFVRFNDLRDFNVGATVILRVASFVDQYRVRHEYIKRVRTRFRAEGIEDPFPVIVQR
ncbi:MAG: mechanosensitive ion channel [Acidobacteriota bacterium]|nr:mechanosensitive ion channel [Acidobacteriota bacterium]